MDYRPNIDAMLWFGNDILPQIHQHIPNTLLYIVGQKPHPRLDTLRDKEHIKITGWVAEVQPYFNAADVYVAPLRMGSGTRLKILQAMASGCAVVATSTAASGLLANGQQAMIIANDESDTKQAIVGLLQNREARDVLGASAREFARKYYDWTALIPDLLAAYEEIGLG
jgi:glycosyltransferase involved in cell wall biosynthesis